MRGGDALRESVKRLRRAHAPLLGAVLNQVDMNSKEYGLYGQYYYDRRLHPDEESASRA